MCDLGVLLLTTLFLPSLPLNSLHKVCILFIDWTLQIGGLFPSPPPHPTPRFLREEE